MYKVPVMWPSTWKATPMHSPWSLKAGPPLFPEKRKKIDSVFLDYLIIKT
jgi:hypothetical protein